MNFYRRIKYLMGSPVEVTAYGEKEICSEGMEAAFGEVARIERLLSIYRPESALSRINRFSKKGFIPVDAEVLDLLIQVIDYAAKSGGAFDPTAGALIRLWGFGPGAEKRAPPKGTEIQSLRRCVGYQNLKVHPGSGELELLREGIEINPGGIGKGYAIDRAIQKLKEAGIRRGMVSCGSTAYALGSPPGQAAWQFEIQHPRVKENRIGAVSLCDQAISTSGDYERFFVFEGRRFSHLIDPRSGYPAEGTASVSAVASTAMEADFLSTAAFILGEAAEKLFGGFRGSSGLMVREDTEGALSFHPTSEWKGPFSRSFSRRRFLASAAAVLIGLLLPLRAEAVVVYATEEEALRRMMPEADRFDPEPVQLSEAQLTKAQQLTGTAIRDKAYHFRIGRKGEEVVGYAIKLDVIGKERPITFLIGIEPSAEIKGMEVLVYRESEGSEVRHPRFMRQFSKKKKEDPLRLGRDIQPISGATLSSRAAAYAARKALAIFEVVYKKD